MAKNYNIPYLHKYELNDGSYYDGISEYTNAPMVARWSERENRFVGLYHTWQEQVEIEMSHHLDSPNENYTLFYPIAESFPKNFELLKEYDYGSN